MRKLLQSILVGSVMVLASLAANAITLSYVVDAGSGFGITSTQVSGVSTLDKSPSFGVINFDPALGTDIDIVTYTLTTFNPAGTSGGDTFNVNDNYTIRFISGDFNVLGLNPIGGFAGASEVLDFNQNITFTLSGVRIGNSNHTAATSIITPASGTLGGNLVNLTYVSLDFPGAPKELFPGGPGLSQGDLTDHVSSSVPEPSAMGLLAASLVPMTMFGIRRRRMS